MRLVLQCAMCGTHHPVGTPVCSTCRASGVTQLRLMFECQKCGQLGLNPYCETCPRSPSSPVADPFEVLELDDELIVAEEVIEEPLTLDDDFLDFDSDLELDFDELEIDLGEQEGEKTILSLSDDLEKTEFENLDSDLADAELDEELEEELDDWDDDE